MCREAATDLACRKPSAALDGRDGGFSRGTVRVRVPEDRALKQRRVALDDGGGWKRRAPDRDRSVMRA